MRRVDLFEATMQGWARLNSQQRERFFQAGLKAALRLDRLEFRAWLLRRLGHPPLAAPIDLTRYTISDADMALLLKQLFIRAHPGGRCQSRQHHGADRHGVTSSRQRHHDGQAAGGAHRERTSRHHLDTMRAINLVAVEAKTGQNPPIGDMPKTIRSPRRLWLAICLGR